MARGAILSNSTKNEKKRNTNVIKISYRTKNEYQ